MNKYKLFFLIIGFSGLICTSFRVTEASLLLSDDFEEGNSWNTVVFSVNGGTGASPILATGGNPGAYRQMQISLPNAPGGQRSVAAVINFLDGFFHDPSVSGPVTGFDFSLDLRRDVSASGAVGTGLAVRQAGEIYLANITYFHTANWVTLSETFGPEDFLRLDATNLQTGEELGSFPDLSVTGAPFEVGFYTRNSTSISGAGYNRTYGIDNWDLAIIPEPSAHALMAGLVPLGLAVYSRRFFLNGKS